MKWLKRILLALLAIVLLAVVVLYGWSAMIIGKEYSPEARTITLSSRPEIIRRGERLAQAFGCFHGCHGPDMEGQVMFEERFVGRLVAPNLTNAADRYSITKLEAIVRQGVLPDGGSVFVMPSDGFSIMTDEDLSAILSFIRSYPKNESELGQTELGPLARFALIKGDFWPAASRADAKPWREGFRDDPMKLGQYVATNACTECHGLELEGREGFTPPLTIAKAYSIDDFRKLMATGTGLGERDLGLMSRMSIKRFSHLTDDEVGALHGYLQSL